MFYGFFVNVCVIWWKYEMVFAYLQMSKYIVGLFVLYVFMITRYDRIVKPGVLWYVGLCCDAGNVFIQQFRDGKMLCTYILLSVA